MRRFFFDVASQTCTRYDYRGRECANADDALGFAELIALDVGCSEDAEPFSEVQVRDIRGTQLFSVPVQPSALIAA